jgi:hypothetical protein
MNWRLLTRRDILGLGVAAVIVGGVLYILVVLPHLSRPTKSNYGFGPDWTCTDPGHGDPVCVKKPAK